MSKSRMGAPRRVATGLLAGALMIVGIAHAPAAGATDDVTSERLAGATRYGTAAAISADDAFDGATTAIIATGENFPDALAASGLAGDNAAAPILLTQTDELSDECLAALDDLAVSEVTVVGGTAAVSDDVVNSLEENGYTVNRVAGTDRYETAAAIANEMDTVGEVDGLVTALIATGENYPDALAGGPAAYAGGLPILLVNSDGVPAATSAAIDDLGIEQAIVLGGTAAVSEDTRAELADETGNDVIVEAGENRYGTAAAVGEFEIDTLGFDGPDYILASGENFPDALAGGPLGGQLMAPIVLTATDALPDESQAFLDAHSDIFSHQIVLGGPAAVSEEAEAAGEAAAETTDNDTPTGGDTVTSSLVGPELQSAAISGIDIDEFAITYSYVFDTDLDEDVVNPDSFKLYNADTQNPATGGTFNGGDDMDIDGDTVAVLFNLADYGVANATLAAVEEDAVEDENGNPNPPQSVATGGIGNEAGTGLVSVEITDEDNGIAEFTFSSPAIPAATASGTQFELIDKDGTVIVANNVAGDGTSAANTPNEDELSYTIEVDFNTDLSDNTIRRAVTRTNPLLGGNTSDVRVNAVDVASGGTTDGPDLVSVELPGDNADLGDNQALFTFDEVIDTVGTSPSQFGLVYSHCDPAAGAVGDGSINALIGAFDGTDDFSQDGQGFSDTAADGLLFGSSCIVTGIDLAGGDASAATADTDAVDTFGNRSVLVTFGSDDIDNDFVIAGQIRGDATGQAVSGPIEHTPGTLEAHDDEVEISQDDSVYADGEVAGPQLIGADVTVDTSVLGEFRKYVVTFTFDTDLADSGAAVTGFSFWFDDGEDLRSEDLTGCEVKHDTTVECEVTDEDSDLANATVLSVDYDSVDTDATFAIDRLQLHDTFPNPEASIEVTVPDLP